MKKGAENTDYPLAEAELNVPEAFLNLLFNKSHICSCTVTGQTAAFCAQLLVQCVRCCQARSCK